MGKRRARTLETQRRAQEMAVHPLVEAVARHEGRRVASRVCETRVVVRAQIMLEPHLAGAWLRLRPSDAASALAGS